MEITLLNIWSCLEQADALFWLTKGKALCGIMQI